MSLEVALLFVAILVAVMGLFAESLVYDGVATALVATALVLQGRRYRRR